MSGSKVREFPSVDYRDAPEWFHRFLHQLNDFTKDVNEALGGKLTLTKHMLAQFVEVYLTTGTNVEDSFNSNTFVIRNTLGTVPTLVLVKDLQDVTDAANPPMSESAGCTWAPTVDGNVLIKYVTGLASDRTYKINFVMLA